MTIISSITLAHHNVSLWVESRFIPLTLVIVQVLLVPHPAVADAILAWLRSFYGANVDVGRASDTRAVWVSLAEGGHEGKSYGQALSTQSIADRCQKYLGNPKIHATRHWFAKTYLEKGGSIRELQKLLGHSSVATTEIYVGKLIVEENKYGEDFADALGLLD